MKKSFCLGCVAALILLGPARSEVLMQNVDSENTGIAVEQIGVLAYPASMTYEGVYSGEVRAVVSVSDKGELTDCLITGYTQEAFAEVALAALKRWKYHPAQVRGEPRASRAEIVFEFRDQGVIVQSLPGAIIRRAFYSAIDEQFVYKPCRLRDLDRIPVPVHVVTPAVNATKDEHKVVVSFYIDEEGRVRMPAVDREYADDLYAAASVAAVEQWRFEPPLRKGKPVLVSAQQEFNFKTK
jgi:TonB family protein